MMLLLASLSNQVTSGCSSMPASLEVPTVVLVRVEVGGDDHAVGELATGQGVLGLLTLHRGAKLDKYLSAAGDFNSRHRSRNFEATHLSKLAALLPDVLQDVL